MREDYKSLKGINLTVLEIMLRLIMGAGGGAGAGRAGQLSLGVN